MKRMLWTAALCIALVLCCMGTAAALEPGDAIGWVLNTNITAKIDGCEISSYNIDGETYVIAEDLAEYGFNVQWIAEEDRLWIDIEPAGVVSAAKPTERTSGADRPAPGTPAMPYLYTNITTWIGSSERTGTAPDGTPRFSRWDAVQIPCCNIGGQTCVRMDDIAEYFAADYVWDPAKDELRLTRAGTSCGNAALDAAEREVSRLTGEMLLSSTQRGRFWGEFFLGTFSFTPMRYLAGWTEDALTLTAVVRSADLSGLRPGLNGRANAEALLYSVTSIKNLPTAVRTVEVHMKREGNEWTLAEDNAELISALLGGLFTPEEIEGVL